MKDFGVQKTKGFTLIELLLVVSVIGILSTIVMVRNNNAIIRARDSRRKLDLDQVRKALEIYRESYTGQYPGEGFCDSSIGSCGTACPCSPAQNNWTATSGIWTALVNNNILKRVPIDPLNNSIYYYEYEPDGNGQGAPPCVGICRYYLRVRLEETGAFYTIYSANR